MYNKGIISSSSTPGIKNQYSVPMKPHKKHIWIDNVAARAVLYIAILAIGYLLIIYLYDAIRWLFPGKLYFKEILVSAVVIPLLVLPFISVRRFLRDRNLLSRQIPDHKTDIRYTNALHLFSKRNNKQSNAIGLMEMVRLKQDGLIDPTHIDIMTVGQDLSEAPLNGANLQGADLQRTNLEGADLQRANLDGANLQRANLQEADLQGANLQGANLQGANLHGADLKGANLEEVKNLDPDMLRKAKNWREARLEPTTRQQAEEADRTDKESGEDD